MRARRALDAARRGVGRAAARAAASASDARVVSARFSWASAGPARALATRTIDAVAPGSTFRLASASSEVLVEVFPHGRPTETIEIEVVDDAHDAWFDVSRSGNEGEIIEVRDVRAVGSAEASTATRVRATVPPRFCGVDVSLSGERSSVFVESVIEAALKLRTNGGDVGLGSIKGSIMEVDTKGGSVRARASVSADSRVRTEGGDVVMGGKFVGSVVYVDTEPNVEAPHQGGGKFQAEAVFADKINVNTGGGAVAAKSVRVGEFGLLRTSGGSIAIGALEGAGDEMIGIDSGGGDIDVTFGERVHIAHVNSRGGVVSASFPSGFSTAPHVVGVHEGELIDRVVPLPDPAIEHPRGVRIVHDDTDPIARKVAAASEGSSVVLDAGAGDVRLRAHSWFARAIAGLSAS